MQYFLILASGSESLRLAEILISGCWMFLNLTLGALMNIQHQVSSIQNHPRKSDGLASSPHEVLNRFMQC
jgi:hypothetical protein